MRFIFPILILFCQFNSFSQNWINSAGGNSNDESFDVEVDVFGNSYTTGYVTGATLFGTSLNVQSNGYSDIYVSKSNSSGDFVWSKTFGGNSADRGYDLILDDVGNIYITGFFIGTANFDNIILNSNGNSQDFFVAKLDNNGNVLWAIAEGGTDAETGYGLNVDDQGNVIVTGQFKGTTDIGGNIFTSATDPLTGLQTFDFFVAKYDSNGSNLWSLNGFADYDDRGLAVAIDENNNINISGQFSDTLQFAGSTIYNTIYNAGMVFQLDPNGNLNWFKRLGAYQTVAYDIEVDLQNNIYVTGDFQGQMVVFDSPNFYLNGNYTYRYFVLKMDETGHVIWGESAGSESKLSSKAICLDANNDIYIAGTFHCMLDDYADSLGEGLFNSVGYADVFITKFLNNGTRDWVYQSGGQRNDYCSGIAVSEINNPVISGSFDKYFNFPVNPSFNPNISGNDFGVPNSCQNTSTSACVNGTYYKFLEAHKSKDILIGKLFNAGLNHYNFYNVGNSYGCYDIPAPCFKIEGSLNCLDTLVNCGPENLYFWTHTVGNGISEDVWLYDDFAPFHPYHLSNGYDDYIHHYGPYWDYYWNVSNDSVDFVTISTTGDYYFEGGRQDGCDYHSDSIYVQINPIPTLPFLTDDNGFNTAQFPLYKDIKLCPPDSVLLHFGPIDTNEVISFTFPDGQVFIDSNDFYISQSGLSLINISNSYGCTNFTDVEVIHDVLINDTVVPYLRLYDLDDFNDSITICKDEFISVFVYDSITNPNGNILNPFSAFTYSQSWNLGTNIALFGSQMPVIGSLYYPQNTGWYHFEVNFILGDINTCGVDTTWYNVVDSFYVEVNPRPISNVAVTGESPFCPGDTVNIWTSDVMPGGSWNGPGIVATNSVGDSILAIIEGTYSYQFTLTDSLTGCSKNFSPNFLLNVKPAPNIFSNSPDNIICPYDSILLSAPLAIAYEWVGPQGNVLGNTQDIYVDVVGFYHCIITGFDFCQMTSNTIELLEYTSPYLIAEPDTELCHSGVIDLIMEHSGSPSFNWLNPAGLITSQITVSQPGTYVAEVLQCGFTVTDSILITLSSITATATALTDSIICPGDTVLLIANPPGMLFYEWSDDAGYNNVAFVTEAGNYSVTVTQANGCTATSNSVNVSYHNGAVAPIAHGTVVCQGDTAVIFGVGNSTINWYDENHQYLFSGDSLILSELLSDTLFYITNSDTNCESDFVAIAAQVYLSSLTPQIIANDSSYCAGDNVILNSSTPFLNHNWTLIDNSNTTSTEVAYFSADSTIFGYVFLQVGDANCTSPTDSFYVEIHPNPILEGSFNDTIVCVNEMVSLNVGSNGNTYFESNSTYFSDTIMILTNPGYYTFMAVNAFGCTVYDTINLSNYPLSNPSMYPSEQICGIDSLSFLFNDSTFWNVNSQGLNGYGMSTPFITFSQQDFLTYYEIDANGCESNNSVITVEVTSDQAPLILSFDSIYCQGEEVVLYTANNLNNYWLMDGTQIAGPTLIFNATFSDTIALWGELNGCFTDTSMMWITVIDTLITPSIYSDSLNCFGDDILLFATDWNDSLSHWNTPTGSVYTDSIYISNFGVSDIGLYEVISNNQGCISSSSLSLGMYDLPVSPFASTNVLNFCEYDSLQLGFALDTNYSYNFWYQSQPISYDSLIILNSLTPSNSGLLIANVIDSNGCELIDTLKIEVFEYPVINIFDTTICIGTSFSYVLNGQYEEYYWQDGSELSSLEVSDSGSYFVEVINGPCYNYDSSFVSVIDCTPLTANVFTPNGDGENDFYKFNYGQLLSCEIIIFNRWGKVVYESRDNNFLWEGTHYFTGVDLNEGTYFYVVTGIKTDYVEFEVSGFITLLR